MLGCQKCSADGLRCEDCSGMTGHDKKCRKVGPAMGCPALVVLCRLRHPWQRLHIWCCAPPLRRPANPCARVLLLQCANPLCECKKDASICTGCRYVPGKALWLDTRANTCREVRCCCACKMRQASLHNSARPPTWC